MNHMSGPKKIIDLDGTPESLWKVDPKALHIHGNKLWALEVAGCVLCVEAERSDVRGQTFRSSDDEHTFMCLTHGALEEVQFSIKRDFTINIGKFQRVGHQEVKDVILIPKSLSEEERQEIFSRLVDAAASEEQKADLLADD